MKIISYKSVPEAYVKAYIPLEDYNYNVKLQNLHMETIDPADLKYEQPLKEIVQADEIIAKLIDLKPKDKDMILQISVQYGQPLNDEQIDKIIKIFS